MNQLRSITPEDKKQSYWTSAHTKYDKNNKKYTTCAKNFYNDRKGQ